jgi:ubiquinone/menaquinone biosynthesis C-methylase UbiE
MDEAHSMIHEPVHVEAAGIEPIRTAYDSLAGSYDRRWRHYIDLSLTKVIHALALRGDECILDVACGTGELERRLLSRWPALFLTGIDVSPAMLTEAQRKNSGRQIVWLDADAASLPLPDSYFDVVVCANSFHYFRNPTTCLREFRRVLVPGGRLILVDWCDDYLLCKLCSVWLRFTDPAFYGTYTTRACRDLLAAAHLDVVHCERFKAGWLWGMMLLVATPRG